MGKINLAFRRLCRSNWWSKCPIKGQCGSCWWCSWSYFKIW